MTRIGTGREKALRKGIRELTEVAEAAMERGVFPPAVAALAKAAGLRDDLERLIEARQIETIADEVEQLRARADLAVRSGSHQAATAYHRRINELLIERMKADATAAAGEMRDLTPEDLLTVIEGLVADLPVELLRRLGTAIDAKIKPRLATA